jgi:AmmeMemoRadiSam system protein B/AmmeMemoRadiSam system protein A
MSISSLFSSSTCNGQEKDEPESVRPMAVAGSFYPADRGSVMQMMKDYFHPFENSKGESDVSAVIVPHAGYVFSGAVAASAFAQIDPEREYEHIFLLGPSHHVYMDGASVNNRFAAYSTPLGNVPVDTALCNELIKTCSAFSCNPSAHDKEHCLEVQLPFLIYHLKKMPPIVPVIVATQTLSTIEKIADALRPYFNEKNLFVISSDFSHYPSYKDACDVDKLTGEAIEKGSLDDFLDALAQNKEKGIHNLATSACGQSPIATLLYLIKDRKDIRIRHIEYRNSGDSPYGDHQQVVGYHSFVFCKEEKKDDSFSLTDDEKNTLLKIARTSINNKLEKTDKPVCDDGELTATLKMRCGAFVTLNEGGRLRGCIGHFGSDIPLYKMVEEMAQEAAFADPRFYPLQRDELKEVNIEISVLSPMKRIHSIDEFTLHKQGIYISKGRRGGTFLPQVADEVNWTKEEFLGHCAQDKAGIGWNGWKDAELYTYEAVVFKEKEKE